MKLDQPQKDLSPKAQVLLGPLDVLYSLQWVAATGSQHVLSAHNPGIHPEVENSCYARGEEYQVAETSSYSIHELRKAR